MHLAQFAHSLCQDIEKYKFFTPAYKTYKLPVAWKVLYTIVEKAKMEYEASQTEDGLIYSTPGNPRQHKK